MATIEPFRALHYDLDRVGGLQPVVAPPYDVIDAAQRAELLSRSPHNVVEIDLPQGDDPYAHAAEVFDQWFNLEKAGMDKHLSEVKLVTDGQSIFKICRRDGEVMDALRDGQMAFFVAIDDIASKVETDVRQFREDRERFVRALREAAAQTVTGTS